MPRGRGSVAPGQREGRRPGLSAQGPPLRKPKNNQPRDPGRPKTHTHVTHTEQEGNRKGAKPSMPRQGSFHSLQHLQHPQIHYTYYYRFESCGGPRSLFLYICLLQLLFSITAGPIYGPLVPYITLDDARLITKPSVPLHWTACLVMGRVLPPMISRRALHT